MEENQVERPMMKMLPGDEVRQIMWRFAERYDIQMAVAGARQTGRTVVALDVSPALELPAKRLVLLPGGALHGEGNRRGGPKTAFPMAGHCARKANHSREQR